MIDSVPTDRHASTVKDMLFAILKSPWLKVLIALVAIVMMFRFNRINFDNFVGLSNAWGWLVLAFGLMLPSYLIVSYRFWLILLNQGIQINFRKAMTLTMVGSFFDIAMPSNSGGDVIKTAYLVRLVGPGQRTKGIMSVAFDRVLGLLGLFLLAGMTSLVGWQVVRQMPGAKEVLLFLAVVCVALLLFFRVMGARRIHNNAKFQALMQRLPGGKLIVGIVGRFNSLREQPAIFFSVLGLSVLNHIFWCSALLCITIAFSQSVGVVLGFTVFRWQFSVMYLVLPVVLVLVLRLLI